MSESEFEKRRIREPIADPPFEGFGVSVDAGATRTALSGMRQGQSTFS